MGPGSWTQVFMLTVSDLLTELSLAPGGLIKEKFIWTHVSGWWEEQRAAVFMDSGKASAASGHGTQRDKADL